MLRWRFVTALILAPIILGSIVYGNWAVVAVVLLVVIARAAQELARSVEVGDRIETVAGMYGSITGATDETVDVEIASGVVVTMSRAAVRRKVTA